MSKNLWILFLCAFPSNFISGIIPYDPMIIYFAKYHPMFWVVLVGVASTLLVEGINYSVLRTITNLKVMVKIREKHFVKKLIDLFYVSPFVALIMAGFLPIPYYPFRILVILSGYPFFNYLLTVFISKIMRMSCLVWVGHQMNIPDQIIFLFFIGIIVITYTSVFIQSLLKRLCRLKKLEK
ncbi:hypothetical protein JW824_11560 [bacterium]|nr:hypothetical protein [bacterium]